MMQYIISLLSFIKEQAAHRVVDMISSKALIT